MADVKISDLSGATTPLTGAELLELSQVNGATRDSVQATVDQVSYANAKIGAFHDTTDQTGNIAVATAVVFNTGVINTRGVTVASSSRVTFATAGLYAIQITLEFANSDAADRNVNVWLAKNGVAIATSNSITTVPKVGDGGRAHFSLDAVVELAANGYIEVMWLPLNVAVTIDYAAAGAIAPATPSASIMAERIAL